MRSYVLHAMDPHAVDLSAWIEPVVIDVDELETELRRVTLPYVRWEQVSELRNGDMALCRMESAISRFQKDRVKLMIGSGMFRPEIEQASVGMKPGDSKSVSLAEGEVRLTLLEASRKITPELTDGMISALGIDGVSSVESYRCWLRNKKRRQAALERCGDALDALIQKLIEGSEFVLWQEDWQTVVDFRINRSRVLFRQEGKEIETLKPEDFEGRIPVKSYHELVAMEQQDAWRTLCVHLLGRYYAEQDGFAPTGESYEAEIRSYCRTWRSSDEAAREVTPREAFDFFEYNYHAIELLQELVVDQILKEDA